MIKFTDTVLDNPFNDTNYGGKALNYRQREIKMRIYCQLEDDEYTAVCCYNIALIYEKELSDYDSAIEKYTKALEIFLKQDAPYHHWLYRIYERIVDIYIEQKADYISAYINYITVHKNKLLYWTADDHSDDKCNKNYKLKEIYTSFEKFAMIYEYLKLYDLAEENLRIAITFYERNTLRFIMETDNL
ncbi:unnamed protein product [Didymodactylos carnosus]|uniref:Tetratricopeptide repeat protein n=1 Tax=Didymodactylos carnosus TaxID=1234261 RepID=A0A8S2IFA4_9BILA|nr:unnamed protein product [Didymodactylos carnosus]CAF3727059.1 unnamed protein product [Didymodactylos carnosus]